MKLKVIAVYLHLPIANWRIPFGKVGFRPSSIVRLTVYYKSTLRQISGAIFSAGIFLSLYVNSDPLFREPAGAVFNCVIGAGFYRAANEEQHLKYA